MARAQPGDIIQILHRKGRKGEEERTGQPEARQPAVIQLLPDAPRRTPGFLPNNIIFFRENFTKKGTKAVEKKESHRLLHF